MPLRGGFFVITEDDLCLGEKEIAAYMEAQDIELTEEELAFVCKKSRGNAYTVCHTALKVREGMRPGTALEREIEDDFAEYLENHVLVQWDSDLLEFLMQMSVTEEFIKGEDGKIGWEVIRAEEEQAKEGSTINVDMNGTTIVPGDIFDSIRGRDITITFDMGSGIIWSVDGKSVTRDASRDKTGDIDFSVKTGVNAIPADIVNTVTGESYSIQISLAYEGEFGFTAVLSINLGKENAGKTASLFYYNQGTGGLEFICADEIAEDGTASLAFTHASDYVIAIDGDEEEESGGVTENAQPEETDGNSTAVPESPKTGQEKKNVLLPIVAGIIALVGIAFAVVFVKRKKEENGSVKEEGKY